MAAGGHRFAPGSPGPRRAQGRDRKVDKERSATDLIRAEWSQAGRSIPAPVPARARAASNTEPAPIPSEPRGLRGEHHSRKTAQY